MSNGVLLADRLAAEATDVIAAITPMAATSPLLSFAPSRVVPMVQIHGVDGPHAICAGGAGPAILGIDSARSSRRSVGATIARWVDSYGCPAHAADR